MPIFCRQTGTCSWFFTPWGGVANFLLTKRTLVSGVVSVLCDVRSVIEKGLMIHYCVQSNLVFEPHHKYLATCAVKVKSVVEVLHMLFVCTFFFFFGCCNVHIVINNRNRFPELRDFLRLSIIFHVFILYCTGVSLYQCYK